MITEFHRANLKKLATYLEGLPRQYDNFHMRNFYCGNAAAVDEDGQWWPSQLYMEHYQSTGEFECGTAACAVGHGPAAGIKWKQGDSWWSYARKNFVSSTEDSAWEWLFSPAWAVHDNTPQGAAARIRYYLENDGIPVGHAFKAKTVQCYAPYLKEDA